MSAKLATLHRMNWRRFLQILAFIECVQKFRV
jgi:hypothetical protein